MKTKKNKKVAMFALKHRGYDRTAVDEYIASEQARADEVQMSQRERIAALSAQCDTLSNELVLLKGREEQIKCAFLTATQNADKMTADIKARYAAELQRLQLFRAKWQGAYEQLKERYHFDKDALNMESVAVSTQLELQKFLMQDFSLNKGGEKNEMEEYFRGEVQRLTAQQLDAQSAGGKGNQSVDGFKNANALQSNVGSDSNVTSAIGELKQKIKEAENKKKSQNSAAFSFEEALNPTESLADICKSLGLNSL